MRRVAKIIVILAVVISLALAALPFVVPVDAVKGPLIAQAEAATGRAISIGAMRLSFLHGLALEAHDVHIANPEWAKGGDMVTLKSLRLGLELMPLLHKQFRFTDITLESPVITFLRQKDQVNWQWGKTAPAAMLALKVEQAPPTDTPVESPAYSGNVTITNGTVIYKDAASGKTLSLSDIALTLKAPNPHDAASLKTSFTYNGKKADIALTLGTPFGLLSGTPSAVDLTGGYGPLHFSWQGTLARQGNLWDLTGKIHIPAFDAKDLPDGPSLSATNAASATATLPTAPASHWSDAPVNLSALSAANATLAITIDKLTLPQTTLQNIALNLTLANAAATVTTNDIAAYDGSFKLAFAANAQNAASLALVLSQVNIAQLLHDFAHFDKLTGELSGHLALSASGNSRHAMIQALAGKGDFALKDGVLKGINLGAMVRNIAGAFAPSPEQSTAISACLGSFAIKDGVLSNNDLKLDSKEVRAGGAGDIDLPGWQIQYLLKPLLVVQNAPGIVVPVRIEGPLDKPAFKPDLKAALIENLKDPAQLQENVRQLRNTVFNKKALKNLLGQ